MKLRLRNSSHVQRCSRIQRIKDPTKPDGWLSGVIHSHQTKPLLKYLTQSVIYKHTKLSRLQTVIEPLIFI